ncbi:unnamed protein product [Prunus brigantina]
MALSAGQLEQGTRPLRPSRAALDKRCGFDRGAYVLPLEWPNRNEGESLAEITTPVMVKRSDCSDRTAVTKQRSRCLGQDGSGRPRCELGRFAGPQNAWGCFSPMIWPEHGVGRTPFLLGRSVRDLPMLAGIAPSYLSVAENAGRSLMLGCCQRRRGCCFRRRAPTSRALGFSVRLWESSRMTLPASSPERALELSIYRRSSGGTIEAEIICVVEPDRGKWVVKSAFGIVKHGGGVTPINPVRGITSLNGAWTPRGDLTTVSSAVSLTAFGFAL